MRRTQTLGLLTMLATLAVLLIVPAAAFADAQWEPAGQLLTERSLHTATLLQDGRVLVAGGNGALSSAELYYPGLDAWLPALPMTSGRYCHTATRLKDGRVLVVGGTYLSGYLNSAELYNPVTGIWTTVASMEFARTTHTATLLRDGRVLVTGGYGSGPDLTSCELYDPSTDTWTPAASMTFAREGHTATLLKDGRVLVAGGYQQSSAELYDPRTDTWTSAAFMSEVRECATATLLRDGRVLLVGGSGGDRASCELYDPRSDMWTPAASMAAGRSSHTASLLQDGRVLVVGSPRSDDTSTEVYDAVADSWSDAGAMQDVRTYHTATLLLNGSVLVAGGVGQGSFLKSAELYVPGAVLIVGPTAAQYGDCVSLEAAVTPAGVPGVLSFRVNGTLLGLLGKASYDATSGHGSQCYKVCWPAGVYPIGGSFSPEETATVYQSEGWLTVTPEAMTVTPSAKNPATIRVPRPGKPSGVFLLRASFAQEADGCYGPVIGTKVICQLKLQGPQGPGDELPRYTSRACLIGPPGPKATSASFAFGRIPSGTYDVCYFVDDGRYLGEAEGTLTIK